MKLSNLQKKLKKSEQYLPAEDTFFLADRLKDLRGKSALDIGCGSGYLTDILNTNFQLVVGTDISFNTLCTQNYKTQNAICCCLLYTSPSPRDATLSRMPSSA